MPEKLIVDATKRRIFPDLKELYQYKDLLFILAYRDLRARYAQTALGLIWAILEPLATLAFVMVIFKRVLNIDTGNVPYILFSFAGISTWTFFSLTMKESGRSVISAGNMIKKIYFPRLAIPVSKAIVGSVDYLITLVLLAILMLWYGMAPGKFFFMLPIFIIATVVSSLTIGIWISALTIRYRDLQHVVPLVVQFGLFVSPVAYPAEKVIGDSQIFGVLYYLNPMAGIIDGVRWSLFETAAPNAFSWVSYGVVIIMLFTGLLYYKRTERIMADIV